MTWHIRRATTEEAKSIKSFDPFIGDRRIDNWRGELLVCVEHDAVVGYVSFSSSLFYHRPFVALLFVRESHRRRGIGRQLIERVLAHYEGVDVWISTEEANQPASQLFERIGFERMGTIRGLDHEHSVEAFFVHRATQASKQGG